MKITFNKKNKKIKLEVKRCNFFQRFSGLMFSKREKARALLFDFDKPTKMTIHSLFVFFEFVAVWLDEKNEVVDLKIIKPFKFKIKSEKSFVKLVEIPVNREYKEIIKKLGSLCHN